MKILTKYILILISLSLLTSQEKDKVSWFLNNTENIKKLDQERYEMINYELDIMTKEYKNLVIKNLLPKKGTEKVVVGTFFNEDAYLSDLLSFDNPTQAQANALKSHHRGTTYKNKEILINRSVVVNKVLKTQQPEWMDIVKYLGGYSKLAEHGITSEDRYKFDIQTTLKFIRITGENTCLAYVKISGVRKPSDKYSSGYGLEYHHIPIKEEKSYFNEFTGEWEEKDNDGPYALYKYSGTYSMEEIKYCDIYNMVTAKNKGLSKDAGPELRFKFNEHTHLPEQEIITTLDAIDEQFINLGSPYYKPMTQMIVDLVPDEYYMKMDHMVKLSQKEQDELETQINKFREDRLNSYFSMFNNLKTEIKVELEKKISENKSMEENEKGMGWLAKRVLKKRNEELGKMLGEKNNLGNMPGEKGYNHHITLSEELDKINSFSELFEKLSDHATQESFYYPNVTFFERNNIKYTTTLNSVFKNAIWFAINLIQEDSEEDNTCDKCFECGDIWDDLNSNDICGSVGEDKNGDGFCDSKIINNGTTVYGDLRKWSDDQKCSPEDVERECQYHYNSSTHILCSCPEPYIDVNNNGKFDPMGVNCFDYDFSSRKSN